MPRPFFEVRPASGRREAAAPGRRMFTAPGPPPPGRTRRGANIPGGQRRWPPRRPQHGTPASRTGSEPAHPHARGPKGTSPPRDGACGRARRGARSPRATVITVRMTMETSGAGSAARRAAELAPRRGGEGGPMRRRGPAGANPGCGCGRKPRSGGRQAAWPVLRGPARRGRGRAAGSKKGERGSPSGAPRGAVQSHRTYGMSRDEPTTGCPGPAAKPDIRSRGRLFALSADRGRDR